jgi:4-hydroxy 2-oxovalerate aldolase
MKFLDCTLRDGGYYTNWDFDRSLVDLYINSFNSLPVDYLEIGYRSHKKSGYFGEYFYCPEYLIDRIRESSNKSLAVILDEKDVTKNQIPDLLEPCKQKIQLVRIALDPQNIVRALRLAELIKAKSFEVGFNVMYMSKWRQYPDFINELKNLNGLADYFYMVDSYGGVYPDELRDTIKIVKEKTNTVLGFHGHNNLELALINTLTALESGVEIVDATVTGMGRGAGNLKTELFFTVINKKFGVDIDFNALSLVVDTFEQLRKQYEWGTNLPYMVSGANSLPQKDVMEWVTKRFYSINSIILALQSKIGLQGSSELPVFNPKVRFEKVIIVGGGPNARIHSEAISRYIEKQENVCVVHASSKNAKYFKDVNVKQYYCLVGNEGHRLEKVFDSLKIEDCECVLPPSPRVMGSYIPSSLSEYSYELPLISFTDLITDSHTVLALQASLLLDAQEVGLVGYDGYNQGMVSQQERSLTLENEQLFKDFQNNTSVKLVSLTATNYKSIPVESLFSKLI